MTAATINAETAEHTSSQAVFAPQISGPVGRSLPGKMRSSLRHLLPLALVVTAVGGASYAGWEYWTRWRFEVSTDDAYVQRHA